jgi:hypothetical protein
MPVSVDHSPDTLLLENETLSVQVAPGIGGRVVSVVWKPTQRDLLYRSESIAHRVLPAGSPYDPNFAGGIDELLPNDLGESPPWAPGASPLPDHGELWTTELSARRRGRDSVVLEGDLPLCGLSYRRTMSLDGPAIVSDYRIVNRSADSRSFLWKLHAALAVEEGDAIAIPARRSAIADLFYSRWTDQPDMRWPAIQASTRRPRTEARGAPGPDIVPPRASNTTDFWYLWELTRGEAALRRDGLSVRYAFDSTVFPYVWVFASYGGFADSYTVILEPATAMPISLADAVPRGSCTTLAPAAAIETQVRFEVVQEAQSDDAQ